MAINTLLLVAAPILQNYLVDKDSGAPLSAGVVTFYQDNSRATFKNVYYQTGSPGAYSFTQLPNPLTLSAIGTIVNGSGNNVIPFFYPYDESDDTTPQPYYITVDSTGAVRQFTIENFPYLPNAGDNSAADQSLINYIPNGQFLAHNNNAANASPQPATKIQNGVQQIALATSGNAVLSNNTSVVIAQGGSVGWYFIKPNASTDTDFYQFTPIDNEPSTLTGNPRFAVTLSCTNSTGLDSFKELRVRFNNVNRFASDTLNYTFFMEGLNNNPGTLNVTLNYIKYFGTILSGGSAPIDNELKTFTLDNSGYQPFSFAFTFNANTDFTVGTSRDDYIEISIGLPSTINYSSSITDCLLTPGTVSIGSYPEHVDNEVFATAIAGSMPTPAADGTNLYLPLILTSGGVTFDTSVIGKMYPDVVSSKPYHLLGDGSQYLTAGYSVEGIPYARLQAHYMQGSSGGVPRFGTGSNFITAFISLAGTNNLYLFSNKFGTGGTVVVPVDHGTGFTFSSICSANATTYGGNAYRTRQDSFSIRCSAIGTVTAATAGTSGFTVANAINNASVKSIINVTSILAAAGLAGKYFTFATTALYAPWFTVDGSGSAPSVPGATLIQINLVSGDTSADVCSKIVNALNGGYGELILTAAGSSITASTYFTFGTVTNSYYVWYQKNNSADPAPGGTGIKVTYTNADTAATIASNTLAAINNTYFAVPDLRGMFLRGQDIPGTWNADINTCFGYMSSNVYGNMLGAYQFDAFQTPTANARIEQGNQDHGTVEADYEIGTGNFDNLPVVFTGGSYETRPVDMTVNWFIKY